jgi:hypothetical protein
VRTGIGDTLASARAALEKRIDEAEAVISLIHSDPAKPGNLAKLRGDLIENGRPIDGAERLIIGYLDELTSRIAHHVNCLPPGVSNRRLRRVAGTLRAAAESYFSCFEPIDQTAKTIADRHPGHAADVYHDAATPRVSATSGPQPHRSPVPGPAPPRWHKP